MDSRPIILVADDEPAATRLVVRSLSAEGFQVASAGGGREAIERVWDLNPDLLLLDDQMPDLGGLDVLRELRATHPVRVILMSANDSVTRVTEALDEGADDVVTKPFAAPELAARIRAVLRRRWHLLKGRRRIGSVIADLDRRQLIVDERPVAPDRREWRLLERLLAADGGIVTHDELLLAAFGPAYVGDAAYLRLWIGQLRRRLGIAAWEEGAIRTIPGLGYQLDPEGEVPVRRVRRPRAPASRPARPRRRAAGP